MKKELLLLFGIVFIVNYMAFAFVNWDVAWAAHVDVIARWFFILILVSFYSMWATFYLNDN